MKKIITVGLIALSIVKFDSVLISTMDLVDYIGTKTNKSTIELIDGLNDIYYNLGYK